MHLDKEESISFHSEANRKSILLTVKVRAVTVPEAMRRLVKINSFMVLAVEFQALFSRAGAGCCLGEWSAGESKRTDWIRPCKALYTRPILHWKILARHILSHHGVITDINTL